ncbi:MAG: hypothetical protein ACTHPD_15155 [Rhizomicrobium sp.]
MRVEVRPIHGWGWLTGEGAAMEVPSPFSLSAEKISHAPFLAVGFVVTQNHPLTGIWIELIQRHVEWDSDCNLRAFSKRPQSAEESPDVATGFAQATYKSS